MGKTIAEIDGIRDNVIKKAVEDKEIVKIYVHMGTCGIASGATSVLATLRKEIKDNKFKGAKIITTGCAGICSKEPLITVAAPGQEPIMYEYIDDENIKKCSNCSMCREVCPTYIALPRESSFAGGKITWSGSVSGLPNPSFHTALFAPLA